MFTRTSKVLPVAALAALALAVPAGAPLLVPAAAQAQARLPAPYVSHALDSVLLPVDGSVISAFGLAPGSRGVLVLATQPGGLADRAGILPGDVIDFVRGRPVLSPIDLDEVVYWWLLQGVTDFAFDGFRAGSAYVTETVITLEYWEEVIEITEISSWSSFSYESFSYTEFYSEYSEEISVSYEESFLSIEETVTSESYAEEMSAEESEDGDAVDAAEEEGMDEGVEEGLEGVDEGVDEGMDDAAADCPGEIVDGVCVEDEAVDEEVVDEGGDEGDDEYVDDGGDDYVDDGGDDGGGEEEIIEE